jgi:hypothetical protein
MHDYSDTPDADFFKSSTYASALATTAAFRRTAALILAGVGLVVLLGSLISLEPVAKLFLQGSALAGFAIGVAFRFLTEFFGEGGIFWLILSAVSVVLVAVFAEVLARMTRQIANNYAQHLPEADMGAQALQWSKRNWRLYRNAAFFLIALIAISPFSAQGAANKGASDAAIIISLFIVYVGHFALLLTHSNAPHRLNLVAELVDAKLYAVSLDSGSKSKSKAQAWLDGEGGYTWLSQLAACGLLNLRTEEGVESLARGLCIDNPSHIDFARRDAKRIQRNWLQSLPQPKMVGICSDAS